MSFFTSHGRVKFDDSWKVGGKVYPLQAVKNALDNAFPSRIQFSCPHHTATQLYPSVDIALHPDFSEYWGLDVLHDGVSWLQYYDRGSEEWRTFPASGGLPQANFGCELTADITELINGIMAAGAPPWHIRIRWSDGETETDGLETSLVNIPVLESVRIWPSAEMGQPLNSDTVIPLIASYVSSVGGGGGGGGGSVSPATTTNAGIVRLATGAEVTSGSNSSAVITPYALTHNDIAFSGAIYMDYSLNVADSATVGYNLDVYGSLDVGEQISVHGPVYADIIFVNTDIFTSGGIYSFGGGAAALGPVCAAGYVDVGGAVHADGPVYVGGAVYADGLRVQTQLKDITNTTASSSTISVLSGGTSLRYTKPLTSLTISDVSTFSQESVIKFIAGAGCTINLPASVGLVEGGAVSEGNVEIEAGSAYIMAFSEKQAVVVPCQSSAVVYAIPVPPELFNGAVWDAVDLGVDPYYINTSLDDLIPYGTGYYTFDLSATYFTKIEVWGGAPELWLYDGNGCEIQHIDGEDDPFMQVVLRPGTYYIRVRDNGASSLELHVYLTDTNNM